MTDLAAARERHAPKFSTYWQRDCCVVCGASWPCDAALFRDALDAERAAHEEAERALYNDKQAARALADELAVKVGDLTIERNRLRQLLAALLDHAVEVNVAGTDATVMAMQFADMDNARAALAKWEASHGHQHSFVWPSDAPGCPPRPCACGVEWEASQK